MKRRGRTLAAIAAGLLAFLGLGAGLATSASAAIPATVIVLPALYTSSSNPLGMALVPLNWAGIGNNSTCTTGAAVVNDTMGVWQAAHAGCAADWQIVPDSTNTFQIQYNANGLTSANLCVSTISNLQGTRSRLRPCAPGGNTWQAFETEPANSDITGGVEIVPVADPSLALNDFGYKGNGGSVGLWPITTGVNQIWASVAGPGLPA
jgi:hypothetical protein